SLGVLGLGVAVGADTPTAQNAPVVATNQVPKATPAKELKKLSIAELMKLNVLSSASFFEVESVKSPGFSQTFNADDLENSPIRTLGDLIDMKCPTFCLGGSPREGLQIGGRGVTSENSWRRVEVITGPGAIVHGSGAFDGFINMTPRNGTDDAGLTTTLETGLKDGFSKLEAGYGFAYGPGRDVYIDVAYFTAQGFEPNDKWGYEQSQANQTWATQLGNFDTKAMLRTARPYRFEGDNYRVATYWNHDNLNAHVIFGQTQQDMFSFNEQGYVHSQYLLWQGKYLAELSGDQSLEYILSGELFDEYYRWSADTLHAFGSGLGQKSGGDEVDVEGKLIYRTEKIDKNRIALGGVVAVRDMNSMQQLFRSNDLIGPGNDATGKYVTPGVFGEDIIALTDDLTAYVGLRYDRVIQGTYQSLNSAAGVTAQPFTPDDLDHWSPRAGLVYALGKNDTIKLSYQQGFRFPEPAMHGWHSLFDTILTDGGYQPLPKLKTESLDNIELNYVTKFPEQHLDLSFNLFHNTYNNRLTWIWFKRGDGYVQPAGWDYVNKKVGWIGSYVNIDGKEYVDGAEAIVSYKLNDYLQLNAGYEVLHIDNLDMVRYPNQQLKLNLKSELFAKRLVFDAYYIANPGGIDNPDSTQNPIYDHSRSMVNLAVSYKLTENTTLKLVVQNLFEDDVPPPTFNMDSPQSGHTGWDARRVYLSMITHF
ncbi:MAG: TonB-dependent receptor, partial [Kiritimatiellaeota bacterium]|nr:TonB-dependent receptor [Kiritimatiellota bacterium]